MTSPVLRRWRACLRASRPPFLLLAPLCALLGIATARPAAIADVVLVLLGSVLAHAAVNLFNEYHDYRSGLDERTRPTPFSGGSGALPACPAAALWVRRAALGCMAAVMLIGVYFLWRRGPAMLWFGIGGLALVMTYSGWILRHPWVCLLAPGLGFGPLMVLGGHWAVSGALNPTVWLIAPVPWLLASALLLVNQLPDIEPDRQVGRHHAAILLGPVRAARLAASMNLAALLFLGAAWGLKGLPAVTGWALLMAPAFVALAIALWRLRGADLEGDRRLLLRVMAAQVGLLLTLLALLDALLILAG